jgi:tetratricopeptide (TPR) repeat protein
VPNFRNFAAILLCACSLTQAQESHDHGIPEKLGKVSFPISCAPAVQSDFNRGIALLHSFAYAPANAAFQKIASEDPNCAIAHWAIAMTVFHQLWEPPFAAPALAEAQHEIATAEQIGSSDPRERGYIHAFSLLFENSGSTPFSVRNQHYEQAMRELAARNKSDLEVQIFYALSLISNAPPTDKSHARDKQALAILEPLDLAYPGHPGITHYIIHASDSTELAPRGLAAARKYAQVAPSAPHALHMPSHIFTRLGLWQDSINSNLAAAEAAHNQHDIGEQLHAMDYLVYAYLQLGQDENAQHVIDQVSRMESLGMSDFKVGYAATAMPVRYAVERKRWNEAAAIADVAPPLKTPPQVAAIAVWANALGRARGGRAHAYRDIGILKVYKDQLKQAGNEYWASQVQVLLDEAQAWEFQNDGDPQRAVTYMRFAADEEDGLEKLPVTPGPIVPAREQLGELLLQQHRPAEAASEFKASLVNAPNRKGSLDGLHAAEQNRDSR